MTPMIETYELPSVPNLKVVRDAHGGHWLCAGRVNSYTDLHGEGCVPLDEIVYDRGFGG
jgi:hypothetical protein